MTDKEWLDRREKKHAFQMKQIKQHLNAAKPAKKQAKGKKS